MEDYIGEIKLFAGDFPPFGWMFCDGKALSINEYPQLFLTIQTTYGGDSKRMLFNLPDLRNRVPKHVGGKDVGLTDIKLGEYSGKEDTSVGVENLPKHSHRATFTKKGDRDLSPIDAKVTVYASKDEASQDTPTQGFWSSGQVQKGFQVIDSDSNYSSTSNTTMNSNAINIKTIGESGISGGTVSLSEEGKDKTIPMRQPSVGINYIICYTYGTFSRP